MENKFQEQVLSLPDDYEGKVIAVLSKLKCETLSSRATLYIHGFNDYFFQTEMAERFNDEGYNFYALDLRRYGRAYLSHQTFNDIRNLRSYFREILDAIKIIKAEGNSTILLGGHSTGGLIVTLFAYEYDHLIQGVWLNSPFFEFNKNIFVRKIVIPIISKIGKKNPKRPIPGGFSKQYGISLHKSEKGEWNYDLQLKPHIPPIVTAGWIRAIHKAHKKIKGGIYIEVPILMLTSDHSSNVDKEWSDKAQSSDIILNVKSITRKAKLIDADIEIIKIKNGMHDLFLSASESREIAYKNLFEWMRKHFPLQSD